MDGFRINLAAKMTGLTEFTLRAWERRYGATEPYRNESGHRVYSAREIEKLILLRRLTEAGHSIKALAKLEIPKLNALAKKSSAETSDEHVLTDLLAATTEIKLAEFSARLRAAQLDRDTRSFLLGIVGPYLGRLGEQVAAGELEVFHEHAFSAVVRNSLTGILYSLEKVASQKSGAGIVFAAPEGDHHEFGVLIAAILAALRGEPVFYLGPNMPLESLQKSVEMTGSDTLVIACSAPRTVMATSVWRSFVQTLALQLDDRVGLWVGGPRLDELSSVAALKKRGALLMRGFEDLERALRR